MGVSHRVAVAYLHTPRASSGLPFLRLQTAKSDALESSAHSAHGDARSWCMFAPILYYTQQHPALLSLGIPTYKLPF